MAVDAQDYDRRKIYGAIDSSLKLGGGAFPSKTPPQPPTPRPRTLSGYYMDKQGNNLGNLYDDEGNRLAKPKEAIGVQGPPALEASAVTPAPQLPNIFSSNPELSSALQRHVQTTSNGSTWQDNIINQANSAVDHYQSQDSPIVRTHWLSGTGGVSGGNNARTLTYHADGSVEDSLNTPLLTTRQVQTEMANTPGGVLPPWNSPTGKALDTSTGQEVPFSDPLPPTGWLNRAIAASKSGQDTTYDTGAPLGSGQFPKGRVEIGNPSEKTYFSTPSGGTIGMNAGQNENPFTGDRANLIKAIDKSKPQFNSDVAQNKANQYQGGQI